MEATPEACDLTSSQPEDYSTLDAEIDVVEHCTVIKTDVSELEPELLNSQEVADPDFVFAIEQPSSEEQQVENEDAAQNLTPTDLEGYYFSQTVKGEHQYNNYKLLNF